MISIVFFILANRASNAPHVGRDYTSFLIPSLNQKQKHYINKPQIDVWGYFVITQDLYPNDLKLPFLVYDLWSLFEPKIPKVKQLPVVIFGIKNHLKFHAKKSVFPNHLGISVNFFFSTLGFFGISTYFPFAQSLRKFM